MIMRPTNKKKITNSAPFCSLEIGEAFRTDEENLGIKTTPKECGNSYNCILWDKANEVWIATSFPKCEMVERVDAEFTLL